MWKNKIEFLIDKDVPETSQRIVLSKYNTSIFLKKIRIENIPEPYFAIALDEGIDVYFDRGENEVQVHIPPDPAFNAYIFTRFDGVRKVERDPSWERIIELISKL